MAPQVHYIIQIEPVTQSPPPPIQHTKNACLTKACFFGLGLYTAAHDLEVEWIIIKGVSHYADEDESVKDSWRLFASIMAASLTANILSDSMVFRCWPHYGGKWLFIVFFYRVIYRDLYPLLSISLFTGSL